MGTSQTTTADASNNPATAELSVEGMTCQNCARHVTEAIQSVPGVHSATVSLPGKSASVRWQAQGARDMAAVLTAISKAGYEAKGNFPGQSRAS